MKLHLAQANVGTLRFAADDARLTGFSLGARRIRRAAEQASGHIWSDQTVRGTSTFVTRSVWESIESLRDFVYSGVHAQYLKRRSQWFVPADGPSLALWWIPTGELPTIEDALSRLEKLRTRGPTLDAFDFASPHPQGPP